MLHPRSFWLVVLLGSLTGLTALSIDMSLPTLPTLSTAFGASADEAALTLSMFLAGYSVSQLFYGPFADRYGRKPPLLVGLALFTVGGIGCTVSGSIAQLIFWRLVQGVGACVGPILARAIVRDLYDRQRGIQILSYMTLVMSVAPLLAPILGGYLLLLHWRAVFALLALIGLIVMIVTWMALPESVQSRNRHATRPAELLRNFLDFAGRRVCIGYSLLVCFVFCGLFSYISASPFVLIEVFGVPSDRFGYLFGLSAFALMAGALINTRLVRRVAAAVLLRLGVGLIVAAGAAMLICAAFKIGGVAGVIGPILFYVMGLAIVMPNAIAAAMEPVPHLAGFASSLMGCLQTGGASLVGYLVGVLYNHTALPMAAAVAISTTLTGITYFGFLAPLGRRSPGAAAS
ncbi:MAG TPA: Bcr/CflA family multidrug efflux MFS transporter [Stellaceae bacterium]|jgi:DHA1 family bicyclomycin/chloramphenicol resistance-like MFS transporter|nr:Bcr/CflA family multidrug efflux MFS transporter [Stellaceae bacterium]